MNHIDQVESAMNNLLQSLKEKCESFDIPLMGIADVAQWENPPFQPWVPKEFFPQSIFLEAKSVIVIGLPVTLPVLETTSSIFYRELYLTVNSLLDQYSYRLANFLNDRGYPSIFVPRDGYAGVEALVKNPVAFFSHRHAAFLAGLGTFGVNNMLLTPEFGPRVRFGSIFTAAELPSDPLLDLDLCTRCMRCVRMCPAAALDEQDYPAGLTVKKNCAAHSAELNRQGISPCGICIKVCPVGEDRKLFGREDMTIYTNQERHPELHEAWDHVRRYGKR